MADVTQILNAIEEGDPQAAEKLLPLVYEELRKLARHRMAQESPDHTLQATALVHEAYIRLVGPNNKSEWDNRGHFFAAAAEAMRRILVENARRKARKNDAEELIKVGLPDLAEDSPTNQVDLIVLDEALHKLEAEHPQKAQIVKLRFFAGLSLEESAAATNISRATAQRNWSYARAWLFGQLNPSR